MLPQLDVESKRFLATGFQRVRPCMVGIVVGMAIGMAKWKLVNVLLQKT
jgi:hypothetical protein